MHAADTYSPFGSWYFVDRGPLAPASLLFFAVWQMYLQSFFMGLLFLIAGYYTPGSLDRKGPSKFMRDRGFRLGLPLLFFMLVLGPITEYFCSQTWTSTVPTSFANEWLKHMRNGEVLQESGPLWFCLALLIFSLMYAGFRYLSPQNDRYLERPPCTPQMIACALVMAASTFLVRLVAPSGSSFLNMSLGDFPQYLILFSIGIIAARGEWFAKLRFIVGVQWLAFVLPVGLAAWLIITRFGGALRNNGSAYSGGWHWQAASLNVWESFTCIAMCYGLLVGFRDKLNNQTALTKFLSSNAFSVYVFHPPILIMVARMLHPLHGPAVFKFALLTCLVTVLSFSLSALVFRRIPILREIL